MKFQIIKITDKNNIVEEKKELPPDLERNRKTEKKNKIQKNKNNKPF
tara:strand:- start:5077 stop:5217 length:141 start_codon:yes stop_codon:yes gene_type:complete